MKDYSQSILSSEYSFLLQKCVSLHPLSKKCLFAKRFLMEEKFSTNTSKKSYEKPEMEVLVLDPREGVICTSGCCDGYTDY